MVNSTSPGGEIPEAGDPQVVVGGPGESAQDASGQPGSSGKALALDPSLGGDRAVTKPGGPAGSINLSRFPKELRDLIEVYDTDGSGRVDAAELALAIMDMKKTTEEKRMFKRMMVVATLLLVILAASIFGFSILSAELVKDVKVSGSDPVLRTKDGTPVLVASSDFRVNENGELVVRDSITAGASADADGNVTGGAAQDGGRRLSQGESYVATQQVRTQQALHSALPDSFLDALDEITLYSAKGHHLTLAIHGFARVPVLNSRCGNVVHMFTSWGPRVSLDSDDVSFDAELSSMFQNAGFGIAVGGVSGRRLTGVASVSGLFHHIQARVDEESWTCADVPLPQVAPHYVARVTVYRPCSSQTDELQSDCDSMYGGSLPGVAELPAEHASAAMNRLQRIQTSLGLEDGMEGRKYYKYNMTVVNSDSYHAQVTHHPTHPLQDHFHIINTADSTGVDFQWLKVPGISERFHCKAVENVTGQPEYKAEADHQAGLDPNNLFEYVGLDTFGDVVYRHFRLIPDFPSWVNSSSSTDKVVHLWDNAETLELVRILLPGGVMWVFDSYSANADDAAALEALQALLRGPVYPASGGTLTTEQLASLIVDQEAVTENEFADVLWDGLATSPCKDYEADAVSDVTGLIQDDTAVPLIGLAFRDLSLQDIDAYAIIAANGEIGDDEPQMGGWYTMQAVPQGDALYGFAKYSLRAHENSLATADVCSRVCEASVLEVLAHDEANDFQLCGAPALGQMLRCFAELPPMLSKFCERTPLVDSAASCMHAEQAQQADRRLEDHGHQSFEGDVMPDGSHRIDLSAVSWRTRAELSKELGVDLMSQRAFLYANSTGTQTEGVVAETTTRSGVAHARRLMVVECWIDDNHAFPLPGVLCYRFISPPTCTKVGGVQVVACSLKFEIKLEVSSGRRLSEPATPTQLQASRRMVTDRAPPASRKGSSTRRRAPASAKVALTLTVMGEADLISTFFAGGVKLPLYGRIGGQGYIKKSNPSCPDIIPFDLEGGVGIYANVGFAVPLLGDIDLAKMELNLKAKNVMVDEYWTKKRGDRRRRRWWDDWWYGNRRRSAYWVNDRKVPKQCDIEVSAEFCITLALLKGCLESSYRVNTKRFKVGINAKFYAGLGFIGSWVDLGSWDFIDNTYS